jgi:hypothetical protein
MRNQSLLHKQWARILVGLAMLLLGVPANGQSIGISEFMFQPPPAVATNWPADDYEFIELFNPGSNYNLQGCSFSSGITLTFSNTLILASNRYLAIARNRTAFTNRYPLATNFAAQAYSGQLANEGEKITLKNAGGVTLCTFTYAVGGDWPDRVRGQGASLVLRSADANRDLATNWCNSDALYGTPGASNLCALTDIVINEVLAHTDPPQEDAVELRNLSAQPINLNGWYLSDDPLNRKKYRITNAVVAANSHTVLYQYQFDATNAPLPGNVPFALSESGDQLFLTAADAASNLTRFVDYARFEASANGVSFGLHPDGTGAWVTLDSVTFGTTTPPGSLAYFRSGQGASNSAPRVGPVVFSEVMYHTPNDLAEEEYIELLNVSSNAIPLFDPGYLTNTWRLTQGVDFVFPTNRWMAPGERILVTGASNLTAFRSAYQLAASIQVLGPWTGRLNNAGETLLLYRPDTPNSNGVPFILVDRLDYGDAPPWPKAADGSGPSLERISATNDGNAAANWYAGAPGGSPGASPAIGLFNPTFDPAQPSPGTAFTVTVYVAATSAPSQVLCVTSTGDGISTNRILRDDGLGGDLVAGDSWFSAPISNVSAGTWFYYYFNAQTASGDSISFPPPEIRFAPSANLTLRLASAGIYAVVSPSTAWTTYSIPGIATHSNFFQLYLSDAAECFVDNLSLKDNLTGTERMSNGSFFASLSGGWAGEGNHITSSRETPDTEGTNALLHLRSSGVGSYSNNAFKVILSPRLTATNEPITLSLRVRQADRIINTWSWLAIGTPPPDPYISEIMYHPAQTNDLDYDYVELFNPGTSAVVLANGRLDGVDFDFPSNTLIGPTSTLVCCASTSQIQSAWSIANVAGNWAGNLANDKDSLRLINPYGRELDRAAYRDEFPWPVEADGLGPSLERINPLASGEDVWNWVSSALDTNWMSVVWTNSADVDTNLNLNLFLDSEGRLLLDEVSVKSLPDETELLVNGSFNNNTNEWSFLENHMGARVEPAVGFGGGSGLVMVATFSRFVDPGTDDPLIILYGDALSNTVRSAAIAVTNGGSYRIAFQARRDSLASTLTSQFGTGSNVLNLAQWGTPGRSNSAALSRTSFAITNVSAEATGASTGQPVRIAVRASPAGTGTLFTLHYRLSDTNTYRYTDTVFIPLSMNDGGTNGDLIAGDGAYSALIPFVSSNNTLVRWHVSASLTNGLIARWPALFDPEREVGIWVSTGSPQTHLPNWQLLIDQDPVTYPVANHCTAISPDGQIFVDVIVRHRGGAPAISIPQRGLALRVRNAHSLDTFFAPNQGGINFRHRTNTSRFFYRRILNEPLAYQIQKLIGLATPRWRFICLWINGAPFITTELEDPAEAFLDGNGLALNDFLSRGGNAGVRTLAGDESLNNLNFMLYQLDTASGSNRITRVQSNVWYESVRYSMAFLALIANPDQNIYWNMMQHRRAVDGRWTQYPWDVDYSFVTNTSTFYLPHLHPYYPTPLHPSVISNNDTNGAQFANILFFPETGPDSNFTRPYRQRQQESLWRYCHTLLTAPVLNPMIDALVATVAPAYLQIGVSTNLLTNQANIVKSVITARREFLLNEAWSDKDDSLWNPTNIYDPTRIVINEIMADPLVGGEYLELYNAATQVVDLSNWRLSANAESYAFPLGTFIGPTSYLVVADAQAALTNAFDELAPAGQMIRRYFSLPLWDWAQNWTSGAETITRIVEIPQLSLPRTNATLILRDYLSNVIDSVTYDSIPPWPVAPTGSSIELMAPTADNNNGANWRTCAIIGTPGRINTATADSDEDGMNDAFEQRIIAESGGGFTSVVEVLTGDDFDGDGANNYSEFVAGTDPASNDFPRISLSIEQAGTSVVVRFPTLTLSGPGYEFYSDRRYDLEERTNLSAEATDWTALSGFTNFPGTGADMVYSNQPAIPAGFYRGRIRLIPQR